MTERVDNGGPAFPGSMKPDVYLGMSLRDYFAAQALKWAGHGEWFHQDPTSAAKRAYNMADAMLEARK